LRAGGRAVASVGSLERRDEHRRRRRRRRRARVGLLATALVAVAAVGVAREVSHSGGKGRQTTTGRAALAARRGAPARVDPGGGLPGFILIADRGNNRLLLVDGHRRVLWRYPPRSGPKVPFYFDDDSFFGPGYRTIISNQEDQHTIQIISFPGGRVLWRYGHFGVRGSAPGYLNTPDDAYLLPGGIVSVADAYNCRVLFISERTKRIVRQLGNGVCRHDPPTSLGAVNGATPLPDGGTLVSEINGSWVDDFARDGRLRWAVQAPVSYPSDPQLLAPDRILLADFHKPGAAVLIDRQGRVLWRYGPASGPGALDHPSLATRIAPGLIAANDDYRHRIVLIRLSTGRIVWQYGHTDVKGTGPGYLNTPDGLDLLPTAAARRIPVLRRLVAARPAAPPPTSPRPGSIAAAPAAFELGSPVEREVAVRDGSRILIAGGLDARNASAAGVFSLDPHTGRLRRLGQMPYAFHDAAGAMLGGRLLVFGGGVTTSSDAVQAFDPATDSGSVVGHLPRPLSDLAAASGRGVVYLVGGYDGTTARSEVWSTSDGTSFRLVARLPVGLRYPAVAIAGGRLVVAGGTTDGAAAVAGVYSVDPLTGDVSPLGRLAAPLAHASALALGGLVYVAGGRNAAGSAVGGITRIDPLRGTIARVGSTGRPVADAAAVATGPRSGLLLGGWRGAPVAQVLVLGIPGPH
jgi:hypothetical protein